MSGLVIALTMFALGMGALFLAWVQARWAIGWTVRLEVSDDRQRMWIKRWPAIMLRNHQVSMPASAGATVYNDRGFWSYTLHVEHDSLRIKFGVPVRVGEHQEAQEAAARITASINDAIRAAASAA